MGVGENSRLLAVLGLGGRSVGEMILLLLLLVKPSVVVPVSLFLCLWECLSVGLLGGWGLALGL